MARISRFALREEVLDKLFMLFFQVVGRKDNQNDFQKIIQDLLSPVERIMIAKRITIIYLIMKKIDYVTICDVLKVSPSTVAKFSLLMEKSDGIVPTLKGMVRNEKISIFLEELFLELRRPGTYGVNWRQAWQDKIRFSKKKETGI